MAARRSGFAALIGRPNVGKSTLLNRLTGEKLAIVSHKPQTTRNRILGVVTRPDGQIAFLDTPGVHAPKGALNRHIVDVALQTLDEVDVLLFVIEASESSAPTVHPGDALVLERLRKVRKPTMLLVNKVDRVPRPLLLPLIDVYRKERDFTEIFPVSARTGEGLDRMQKALVGALPEGEQLFDADTLTDQAERHLVAEYIREQVLHQCEKEVPYATAVVVEEFDESEREPSPGRRGLIRISALIVVERQGQKAIVIGKQGQMLKSIGTASRKTIERFLGARVYLALHVRVEPDWTQRAEGLRKLGYE